MTPQLYIATLIFLFGLVIGSFLNVCIYRIPKKENIVTTRSHCMHCGYELKWYDLIPLLSWVLLRGKCRKCGTKVSIQYPLIELLNGILYLFVFIKFGVCIDTVLYCFFVSALLVLSVIDFRTYEIPLGINIWIGLLGLIHVGIHRLDWINYVVGFFSVSLFLYLLYIVTKGRGIGGGDVKLMAVSGLLLGWQNNILAFLLGCMIGSVIHLLRMKITKADHVLAMGPYLATGLVVSMFFGTQLITWYINLL